METTFESFSKEVANHEMTVIREDGLYRHLKFANPNTSRYWFELVTWPGSLAIKGDMGGYMFSRVEDMFKFFRGSEIDPRYWAEKLSPDSCVKEYSEEQFRQIVTEQFVEAVRYSDAPKGLGKAVRQQILDGDIYSEPHARRLLETFEYEGFRFADAWEWDFTGYIWPYLWCCHAIQWGISQHDRLSALSTL